MDCRFMVRVEAELSRVCFWLTREVRPDLAC